LILYLKYELKNTEKQAENCRMDVVENNTEGSKKFSGDFTGKVNSNNLISRMNGSVIALGIRVNLLDVLTSTIPR
jgi:hypothetical protein